MNKKSMAVALALSALAGSVFAQGKPSVWRYVDDAGHVSYSNVPLKGKKGEKIEMMSYPPAAAMPSHYAGGVPAANGTGAPIPAEVLRQIQASGGEKSPSPPAGLPPLPAMPGAVALPGSASSALARAPSAAPAASLPVATAATAPSGPSWAREKAAGSAQAPNWAKDPFAQ